MLATWGASSIAHSILYDIYCLMLLKRLFEAFRCNSLPNFRDLQPKSAIASKSPACLFVPTISVFMRRP